MRLTPQDKALRAITEAQWQRTVQAIAKAHGWRCYHAPRAGVRANGTVRTVEAGWPDLTLVKGARLLFVELKRETGKTTEAQDEWLMALCQASVEVYVWRPSNHADVVSVLGLLCPPKETP